jgi:hypothetical protein
MEAKMEISLNSQMSREEHLRRRCEAFESAIVRIARAVDAPNHNDIDDVIERAEALAQEVAKISP